MPEKLFALHPGWVQSKDGDWHYIGARELASLYGVAWNRCIVVDVRRPASYKGFDLQKLTHLFPRYDGDYRLIPSWKVRRLEGGE